MTDRQDGVVRGQVVAVLQGQSLQSTLFYVEIHDLGFKSDLASQLFNRVLPHLLDHGHEFEGTDVGFAEVQNFRWRSGRDKFGQNLASAKGGVLDLAVEFAIREGACTAFSNWTFEFH